MAGLGTTPNEAPSSYDDEIMKRLALVITVALSGLAGATCNSKSSLVARHDGSPGPGGSQLDAGSTTDDGGAAADLGVGSGDSAASTDSAVACEIELGGICSTMGNECVVCPAGMYVNPTSAGCARNLWCCTKTPPAGNPCTSGGGVCVANGATCPTGWDKMRTSCGGDPNPICCQPREGCGPYPQACVDLGGVCVPNRWSPCPSGTEIHSLGQQFGCGGWCCVDAPPSTCADGLNGRQGMCVPGECTGCFAKVSESALICEAGRSCCTDICD